MYTTNAEYRKCLRELFKMNPKICESKVSATIEHNNEEIDEETADEMRYDQDAVSKAMDYVYDKTKNNALFQKLYDKAAARMISLDREIGLCILFSYDFLPLFRECLDDFMKAPEQFTKTTPSYIALKQKL
jgi:hypothetical protein